MNTRSPVSISVLLSAAMACGAARGESLSLSSAFVEKYKNAAAITVNLRVDEALKRPHRIKSGGDDGDIHMAGRDDVIRLPLVVEIMNAARPELAPALQDLKQAVGGDPVSVTGAWRIWFEHLGKEPQIQGKPVPPPVDSNPAHLFEVHPVTSFHGKDLTQSLVPIPGYTAYPAVKAFEFYEQVPATIQATDTAITLASGSAKYNYTEFVMERIGEIQKGDDNGIFVLANVYDTENGEEKVNASPRRMVFLDGTPPAAQVQALGKGERLHVLGIPRVNLAEVSAIAAQSGSQLYSGTLPYEMIVVAVLP